MAEAHALPKVLTVAEVAAYLRVSETTVWRWCSSGRLAAFRIGRSWRVRRADFDAVIRVTKVDPRPVVATVPTGRDPGSGQALYGPACPDADGPRLAPAPLSQDSGFNPNTS